MKDISPKRISSDSTGFGSFASYIFLDRGRFEHPSLAAGCADDHLRQRAQTANIGYIFGVVATAASIHTFRRRIPGRYNLSR